MFCLFSNFHFILYQYYIIHISFTFTHCLSLYTKCSFLSLFYAFSIEYCNPLPAGYCFTFILYFFFPSYIFLNYVYSCVNANKKPKLIKKSYNKKCGGGERVRKKIEINLNKSYTQAQNNM